MMKPADGAALAAGTWTTEGVASPDRVPVRLKQKCNGGAERALADRALLLKKKNKAKQKPSKEQYKKRKQNKAPTDKDQGKADCFH